MPSRAHRGGASARRHRSSRQASAARTARGDRCQRSCTGPSRRRRVAGYPTPSPTSRSAARFGSARTSSTPRRRLPWWPSSRRRGRNGRSTAGTSGRCPRPMASACRCRVSGQRSRMVGGRPGRDKSVPSRMLLVMRRWPYASAAPWPSGKNPNRCPSRVDTTTGRTMRISRSSAPAESAGPGRELVHEVRGRASVQWDREGEKDVEWTA